MIWDPPLIEATFLKRYKRFFADVEIAGKTHVAHVPNTGSLKGCLESGSRCLLQPATDPKRKLKFTLQFIKSQGHWVGVNTANPPLLLKELIATKNPWPTFDKHQWEVAINDDSRIDLVLWKSKENPNLAGKLTKAQVQAGKFKLHFVEIKNVTLADDKCALFPDCETTRGQKHLQELIHLTEQGHTAEMLYVVQRSECQQFAIAADLDPKYNTLFRQAHDAGVKVTALPCDISPTEVRLRPQSLRVKI